MSIKQMLQILESEEFFSPTAEAYVLVADGKLYADGKVIRTTAKIVDELFKALVKASL